MANKSSYAWVIAACIVVITSCVIGIVLNTASLYMVPILEAHPDWTSAAYGVTQTVQSIVAIFTLLFAGFVINRIGARKTLFFCVAAIVAMQLLLAFGDSLMVFYVAYALFGMSCWIVALITPAILTNAWFAKKQGLVLGLNGAAMGLGAVAFAPIVSGWIANHGYQKSYLYCAVIIAVFGGVACVLLRDKPAPGVKRLYADETESDARAEEATDGMSFGQAVRTKEFWLIAIGMFLINSPFMCYVSVLSNFVMGAGMTLAMAGIFITFYNAVQTAAGLGGGFALEKLGDKAVVFIGAGMFCACCVIGHFLSSLGMDSLWVFGALLGIRAACLIAPIQVLTRRVFGGKAFAQILSIIMILFSISSLPTPLYNAVHDATGSYAATFMPSLAATAVGCVMIACVKVGKKTGAA